MDSKTLEKKRNDIFDFICGCLHIKDPNNMTGEEFANLSAICWGLTSDCTHTLFANEDFDTAEKIFGQCLAQLAKAAGAKAVVKTIKL